MRRGGTASKATLLKPDMEKAYTRGNFLAKVLCKFGFPQKFIDWIMGCITNPKFSVLVNGSPTNWYSSLKELQQGDPLAPLLVYYWS